MSKSESYSMKTADVTPDNCDTEAIHIPGCIQPHGLLFVLRPTELAVLQVSANSHEWLGIMPADLLGRGIEGVIGTDNVALLRNALAREPLENNPRYLFSFAPAGQWDSGPLDVTAHLTQNSLVLEMERTGRSQGDVPDYYGLVKGAMARLQGAATLQEFCQIVTAEVASLTGLDRVMVYRFDEDDSGWVMAETKRDGLDSFLDLHYPATDVPKPARDIYRKIWLRPLPDAQAEPCELVPLTNPDSGMPLDMTYCFLRGASKMYTDYLINMGVRMSLTMAIQRDDRLWGLIACHNYQPTEVPYQVRAACEFFAQVVSLQIKSAEEREHGSYKDRLNKSYDALLKRAHGGVEPDFATFVTDRPNLLDFIAAGGAAVERDGESWALGNTPNRAQREALVNWLRERARASEPDEPVYSTRALSAVYPAAAAYRDSASGLLALPISRSGQDWLLWFRPELIQTVKWAGNPNDKPIVQGPNGPRLMPRNSFAMWQESVRGQSAPWQPVEIEAARRLRVAVLEIVVDHADRIGQLNRQLTISNEELDSFAYVASHDLKEPLRGIFHYAQYLIDECAGKLDDESQRRLHGLMRLTQRMDTLIDSLLLYARVGRVKLTMFEVDLNRTVAEVRDIIGASREDAKVDIQVVAPLPTVQADPVRCRELLINLITNAIKYNDKSERRIEIGARREAGEDIVYVRDNGIGIADQFHEQIFKMFKRLHGRDEFGGGAGAGLTICRKIVERHGGRIWLESTPGSGTTFYFTLAPRSGA